MTIGAVFINDRDLEADFLLYASALNGWPGNLSSAPRDAPLTTGPQMQGATLDPRLIVRKPATATITAIMVQPTAEAARAALDGLRALLWSGAEVMVRTFYAPDRYCMATCVALEGVAHIPEVLDGSVDVQMTFQVKNGLAFRLEPDGYALSSAPTPCPIGSAESRPVITVHGGGGSLVNPGIVVYNAARDVVQRMNFTGTLGSNSALRIDTARGRVSVVTDGTPSDALAAGWWPPGSGDFPLLRPYDGAMEAGQFPLVALTGSGTPLFFTQTVAVPGVWANTPGITRVASAFACADGTALDLIGDSIAGGSGVYTYTPPPPFPTSGPKRVRVRFARSSVPSYKHRLTLQDQTAGDALRFGCDIDLSGVRPIVDMTQGTVESLIEQPDGSWILTATTLTVTAGNAHIFVVYPSTVAGLVSWYVGAIGISTDTIIAGSIAYTRRYS